MYDNNRREYPKRTPYTGVRWEGQQPTVKIGEEWFTLVSIDGVAVEDIVAFSRLTYQDKWKKRFEEDLVEVMAGMGHEPKDKVRLVVRPLGSSETRTIDGVAMTRQTAERLSEQQMRTDKCCRQQVAGVAWPGNRSLDKLPARRSKTLRGEAFAFFRNPCLIYPNCGPSCSISMA